MRNNSWMTRIEALDLHLPHLRTTASHCCSPDTPQLPGVRTFTFVVELRAHTHTTVVSRDFEHFTLEYTLCWIIPLSVGWYNCSELWHSTEWAFSVFYTFMLFPTCNEIFTVNQGAICAFDSKKSRGQSLDGKVNTKRQRSLGSVLETVPHLATWLRFKYTHRWQKDWNGMFFCNEATEVSLVVCHGCPLTESPHGLCSAQMSRVSTFF